MFKSLKERAAEVEAALQYKSVDEAQKSLDKLNADRDAFEKSLKDENGQWKATTPEQREELAKRNADVLAHRSFISIQGENENFKSYGAQRVQMPSQGLFGGQAIDQQKEFKGIGDIFVNDKEYTERKGRFTKGQTFAVKLDDIDGRAYKASAEYEQYKSAVVENTMFAPPNYRIPLVVTSAQRPAILQDYVPTIATTERNAVPYMLETTFTNNAAFVAQTVAPSASVDNFTQQTQAIETLVGYIPVTEQMMEDNVMIAGLLNQRIGLMMMQTLETELISGSGTTPHLRGYLNASGINHQPKGSDDIYTAIAKGINLNRWTGYSEPDYVVMNSTDFLTVRTTKDAIGNFIFGPPNQGNTEVLWGLPVVVTNGITQGTALTGSFKQMSTRFVARGLTLEVGRINDNFVTLEWAIRATMREGLVINRGSAFTYIDGL